MEMKTLRVIAVIVLCSLLAFASGYAIQNRPLPQRHGVTATAANVFITIEEPMGLGADALVGNVITDIGENQSATRASVGASYVAIKYVSVGNATAATGLTKLTTEATNNGGERAEGTVSDLWLYGGDAAFNVTVTFRFTGDITLNACGGHWNGLSDSDGNMYACANFPQTAFGNNWNMTICWVYVFDGNN